MTVTSWTVADSSMRPYTRASQHPSRTAVSWRSFDTSGSGAGPRFKGELEHDPKRPLVFGGTCVPSCARRDAGRRPLSARRRRPRFSSTATPATTSAKASTETSRPPWCIPDRHRQQQPRQRGERLRNFTRSPFPGTWISQRPMVTPLAPGSYGSALPYRTSQNVLRVSASGRGCDIVNGRFWCGRSCSRRTKPSRFAADFEQHCEDAVPALFGAIRYNSTITDLLPFAGTTRSISSRSRPTPTAA